MKKTMIIGLIVVMVLGMSAMSFADTNTFTKGQGRATNIENRINLNFSETFLERSIEILSRLTSWTKEKISESGLTNHEIAAQENVLDKYHSELVEVKTTGLKEFVNDGKITKEKADFMIDRMSQMTGDGSQSALRGAGQLNRITDGRGNRGASKGQGNRVTE